MLWRAIDISKAQMDRCRLLSSPTPGHGKEIIAQHRAILKALAARNPEAAMKALRKQLETSIRITLSYLGADPAHASLLTA